MKALTKEVRFCADTTNGKTLSCKCWHLLVCHNYISESGCSCDDKCRYRHVEAEEKLSKKSKKGGVKGSVCDFRGIYTNGLCNLKILFRQNLVYGRREIGIISHRQLLQRSLAPKLEFGKARIIPKCASQERSPCAPKCEERSHEENLHQERCARRAAWDLAKNIYKLKNSDKAAFYLPGEVHGMSTLVTSKRPEGRASMHVTSKKELRSEEMGTVKRSRKPTEVLTATLTRRHKCSFMT